MAVDPPSVRCLRSLMPRSSSVRPALTGAPRTQHCGNAAVDGTEATCRDGAAGGGPGGPAGR